MKDLCVKSKKNSNVAHMSPNVLFSRIYLIVEELSHCTYVIKCAFMKDTCVKSKKNSNVAHMSPNVLFRGYA